MRLGGSVEFGGTGRSSLEWGGVVMGWGGMGWDGKRWGGVGWVGFGAVCCGRVGCVVGRVG